MGCLNEKILSSYLDEALLESERDRIEDHISKCNHCLDLLWVAYEARGAPQKYPLLKLPRAVHRSLGKAGCPPLLKEKIKKRLGLREKKKGPEVKWFFSAIILFMLSFVVKRFFLQFLVASAILGFKWAMEGEGAKRAVMIFKGIQREEKKFERKSPPPVSDITGGDSYGEGR